MSARVLVQLLLERYNSGTDATVDLVGFGGLHTRALARNLVWEFPRSDMSGSATLLRLHARVKALRDIDTNHCNLAQPM